MAENIKLFGLKELDRKLARMDKRIAFKALRGALMESSKPMFLAAKQNAQATGVKGFDAGAIAASMGRYVKKLAPKRTVLFLGPKNKAKRAINLWNAKHGKNVTRLTHFHLVEFGSKKGPAQPYLRPAFEKNKLAVARNFGRILAKQIEKAAGRAT